MLCKIAAAMLSIAARLGVALCLLGAPAAVLAAEPEPEAADAASPADETPTTATLAERSEATIQKTRRRLEQILGTSSLWVDRWFSPPGPVRTARAPYGSVALSNTWSQFYGTQPRVRFDARIDLPNAEHRLSGFIGRNDDQDVVRDREDNATLLARFPRLNTQDQWLAGLGYRLPGNEVLSTDVRVGVRRVLRPELFLQSPVRYNAYADDRNLVHLRLTPFWTSSEGYGVTFGGDYNHVPSERWLTRWANVGTFSQQYAGLDWRSTASLYQAIFEYSGLAYEAFVRGDTGDPVLIHEYGVQTTLRHPILARNLYAQWVLGYSYPREQTSDERHGSLQIGVGVEMPFGTRPR